MDEDGPVALSRFSKLRTFTWIVPVVICGQLETEIVLSL